VSINLLEDVALTQHGPRCVISIGIGKAKPKNAIGTCSSAEGKGSESNRIMKPKPYLNLYLAHQVIQSLCIPDAYAKPSATPAILWNTEVKVKKNLFSIETPTKIPAGLHLLVTTTLSLAASCHF